MKDKSNGHGYKLTLTPNPRSSVDRLILINAYNVLVGPVSELNTTLPTL